MKTIKFSSYPGGYASKIEMLKVLGLKYTTTFVPSTVPCQSKVVIEIDVNNDLEYYAVRGVMNAI
jgi:hypothetical protein